MKDKKLYVEEKEVLLPVREKKGNRILKVIEENQSHLDLLNGAERYSEVFSLIAFFCFLLLVFLKVLMDSSFPSMFLLAPLIASIVFYTVSINCYLKINDIFYETIPHVQRLSSVFSYSVTNSAAVAAIIYVLGLALKLDELIDSNYIDLSLPIYIEAGVFVCFFIYLFPTLYKHKEIWIICITITSISLILVFISYLNYKLDKTIDTDYTSIFFPLNIFLIILTFKTFYDLIFVNKMVLVQILSFTCAILLLSCSYIIPFRLDLKIKIDIWVPMTILLLIYLSFFVDRVFKLMNNIMDIEESEEDIFN
jgi:hypothetical protein